jgi:hypothetical protein
MAGCKARKALISQQDQGFFAVLDGTDIAAFDQITWQKGQDNETISQVRNAAPRCNFHGDILLRLLHAAGDTR